MSQILILTGSSRPNSAGKSVVEAVKKVVNSRDDVNANVVDVNSLNLPFFNGTASPSTEGFVPEDANAKTWTDQVAAADAVVLVTPEYNGSLSAIQKNAIDWISAEWADKPVALVGYGWGGATRAHENARIVLENVKAKVMPVTTNLSFMKEIGVDGAILHQNKDDTQLNATVDNIVNVLE